MLKRLFHVAVERAGMLVGLGPGDQHGLSSEEVALLHYLRAAPHDSLKGRDLVLARRMASSGHLRVVGDRRYALTEKGVVAYLAER